MFFLYGLFLQQFSVPHTSTMPEMCYRCLTTTTDKIVIAEYVKERRDFAKCIQNIKKSVLENDGGTRNYCNCTDAFLKKISTDSINNLTKDIISYYETCILLKEEKEKISVEWDYSIGGYLVSFWMMFSVITGNINVIVRFVGWISRLFIYKGKRE